MLYRRFLKCVLLNFGGNLGQMDDFRQIIGRKIIEIYLEPTALEIGIADTQIHSEFIYVGS